MQKSVLSIMVVAALLLLASCSKDDNGGQLSYQLKTKNPNATVSRTSSGSVTWTSGSAYADKIEFEAEKDDDNEVEYESRVARRIDLFAPVSQLGNISLPPGRYEEIEIEVDLAPSITDTAFILRGSFTNNIGYTVPVVFYINELLEFKAEAEDITIGSAADITALTTLDLSQLTTGITESMLSSATLTNGVLVISATSNAALYSVILSNINNIDDVELDD